MRIVSETLRHLIIVAQCTTIRLWLAQGLIFEEHAIETG
jgi:hypothetical protein